MPEYAEGTYSQGEDKQRKRAFHQDSPGTSTTKSPPHYKDPIFCQVPEHPLPSQYYSINGEPQSERKQNSAVVLCSELCPLTRGTGAWPHRKGQNSREKELVTAAPCCLPLHHRHVRSLAQGEPGAVGPETLCVRLLETQNSIWHAFRS